MQKLFDSSDEVNKKKQNEESMKLFHDLVLQEHNNINEKKSRIYAFDFDNEKPIKDSNSNYNWEKKGSQWVGKRKLTEDLNKLYKIYDNPFEKRIKKSISYIDFSKTINIISPLDSASNFLKKNHKSSKLFNLGDEKFIEILYSKKKNSQKKNTSFGSSF